MKNFFCFCIRDKESKNEKTFPYLYPKVKNEKCYKCETYIVDLKLAKIWKNNYYFCSEKCWSKWCQSFNK